MKNLSLLKALMLGLFLFTGSTAIARSVAGVAGGYCGEHTSCNCLRNYGDCAWAITDAAYTMASNEMPLSITITSDGDLLVEYLRPLTELDDHILELHSNTSIPRSICTALGVTSITILPGTYQTNYASNPHGNILFKASIVP